MSTAPTTSGAMPRPAKSLHRLRKHADYQRVYKGARKQWAREIAWFATLRKAGTPAAERSETTGPRVGLTVPKALGKAVDRNRIKRRLRAMVRRHLSLLADQPIDLILHPKRSVLHARSQDLDREVRDVFRAARARCRRELPPETGTA